jgi:hypothetical protein
VSHLRQADRPAHARGLRFASTARLGPPSRPGPGPLAPFGGVSLAEVRTSIDLAVGMAETRARTAGKGGGACR